MTFKLERIVRSSVSIRNIVLGEKTLPAVWATRPLCLTGSFDPGSFDPLRLSAFALPFVDCLWAKFGWATRQERRASVRRKLSSVFLLVLFFLVPFGAYAQQKGCELEELKFKPLKKSDGSGAEKDCETFYYRACVAAERELREKCEKGCNIFEKHPFTDTHDHCKSVFKAAAPGFDPSVCKKEDSSVKPECEVTATCTCDP